MLCSATDYHGTCVSTMTKALKLKYNDSSSSVDPKELLSAALLVVTLETKLAFNRSQLFKSNDSEIRLAVTDCQRLYDDCKYNIERSVNRVSGSSADLTHDLQTWMSAVISFEQACMDVFPKGETKEKMKLVMKTAKEVSSNAVSIVRQIGQIISLIDGPNIGEPQLLEEEKEDKFPNWVQKHERSALQADYKSNRRPNVTVAKDGTGNFTTISAALASMPNKYNERYVIYVKEGLYEETVDVSRNMTNLTMYGDGSRKTIITGKKNYKDGTRTWLTATFAVSGDGFIGIGLGFRNTAGPEKFQAVALRVMADRTIFLSCRMEGYQDTIFAQAYRQFYRNCIIKGSVDFIFGDAAAVFQSCIFLVRRPLPSQPTILTAHGRSDRQQTTGFVLQHCKILPDTTLLSDNNNSSKNYLGRPWKSFSRTVIMESHVGAFVHPEGYMPWEGAEIERNSTLYYAEYNNVGGGCDLKKRVKWPGFHAIGSSEAKRFTVGRFLHGNDWIQAAGLPVKLGLYRNK
ncbi:hypothetical protein LUZ60_006577 [Juncus effusus]|nr:hypothetical protein LUZ60_006577 [Juncus effusus]